MAAAGMVLAACQEHVLEEMASQAEPVEIQLTTSLGLEVDAATRAVGTTANKALQDQQFAAISAITGNAIAVYVEDKAASGKVEYATPLLYTPDGSGGLSVAEANKQFYPISSNVDIYAYYPGQNTALIPAAGRARTTTNIDFTVAADQTSVANYAASDLMVATVTNQARTKNAVQLAFAHKLTKITLFVKTESEIPASVLDGATVTINGTRLTANFNFNTRSLVETAASSGNYYTSGTAASPITAMSLTTAGVGTTGTTYKASSYDGQQGSVIVVPQVLAGTTDDPITFITITLADGTTQYSFKTTSSLTLEPGKEYIYTVTLKRTGIVLGTTITNWATPVSSSLDAYQD